MRVGKIIKAEKSGQLLVDFPENQAGPVIARVTTSVKKDLLGKGNPAGREVLLAFDNNDPQRPIIVDTMYSLIDEISEPANVIVEADAPQDAIIDGKRIVFDAREEVVLRCGKANITLTKAGKVLIRGAYLSQQSTGVNQIKGASVKIN